MTTLDTQEQALLAWMERREASLAYSNDRPDKLYPDSSGKSDCSGVIWAAYAAIGVRLQAVDMSYEMAAAGTPIASGATITQFRAIAHLLRPGDIVAMALKSGYGSGTRINHVEMSTGPLLTSWGHGGYPHKYGPVLTDITDAYTLGDATWWTVRRILDLTPDTQPTPTESEPPEMTIIKSPNRPHALAGPGCFHIFRNSEELETALTVLKPAVKDAINDRQYDVVRAVILAGTLDAETTKTQLDTIYAALDKETSE